MAQQDRTLTRNPSPVATGEGSRISSPRPPQQERGSGDEGRRHSHNVPAARWLRAEATLSEQLLWERIRDRRLAGFKFRRQHAIGPYVLDFYCAEARLAIEIDGGVHVRSEQRTRDVGRQEILEDEGIAFLRVTATEVETRMESVLNRIRRTLTPNPSPIAMGEGSSVSPPRPPQRERGSGGEGGPARTLGARTTKAPPRPPQRAGQNPYPGGEG